MLIKSRDNPVVQPTNESVNMETRETQEVAEELKEELSKFKDDIPF